MKKYLIIIFITIGFIVLGSLCFYLKTQIDTARNDILDLTSTVNSQEVKIAETESELDFTKSRLKETKAELAVTYNERDEALELNEELEKELSEVEQELNQVEENLQVQKAETFKLQIELEAVQEELQLYHDTGITVAQGIVPPYRRSVYGNFNLRNNPDATNISWAQLKNFLRKDRTDSNLYVENYYMCGEFAEDLHNNAENIGIKAAWVAIRFEDGSTPHALNAFVTTNKGLVFIDTTGAEFGEDRPEHMDTIATVKVGKRFHREFIFTSDWRFYRSSPVVSMVEIYW